jgi:hypothetical protein
MPGNRFVTVEIEILRARDWRKDPRSSQREWGAQQISKRYVLVMIVTA